MKLDRQTLAPWLLAGALGVPAVTALAALGVEDWRLQRYLVFYLAPILGAFPLWLRARLLARDEWPRAAVAVDAGVVSLATLRFMGGFLPMSGHMLFFTHSALTTRGAYRWLALGLAVETTYFKLALWSDPWSWGLGIALGLVAAVLHGMAMRPARVAA